MHFSLERRCVWGFFLCALVIGLIAAPRYGVSWDEPNMLNLGTDAWNYVFGSGAWPETAGRRYHGPLVEMTLYGMQKLLGFTEPHPIFVLRHVLTYVIFLGGLAAFYALAKRIVGDWKAALTGAAMIFLTPPLFAHAFYNSRDIPEFALFTTSMLTLTVLLEKRTNGWLLLHALATASAIAVRTAGMLIVPITVIMLILNWRRASQLRIAAYLAATTLLAWALWPLLWESPVENLMAAVKFSGSLHREGMYLGVMQAPPWHYLVVWIAATTPVLYMLFCAYGLVPAIKNRRWIPLLWLLLPLLLIIAGNVGLYDGWRHMYFLYPAMILIGLEGVQRIRHKRIVAGVLAASFLWTGVWMVRNHPLQGTYFSLPGRFIARGMERDYWGLSFKEGLLWILRNDLSPRIAVNVTSPPGYYAAFTLPEDAQRRIVYNEENPTYVLDNFRSSHYEERFPEEQKVHEIIVDTLTVLKIYKMR